MCQSGVLVGVCIAHRCRCRQVWCPCPAQNRRHRDKSERCRRERGRAAVSHTFGITSSFSGSGASATANRSTCLRSRVPREDGAFSSACRAPSVQSAHTKPAGMDEAAARRMAHHCLLAPNKVKLLKIQKVCYLNLKSCFLNFLILLYKSLIFFHA